ncbi:aldolase/citrate lyase family protein [Fuscovulum ytuae]|uniref:Aldolase/citrate lyase family protein n=1 Tax=Fuscovulum ytuae TaxID=3042299 RepID=A0ABY8Q3K8_9RHOB|nr:aldolase/citrate lyase family protein [Fuscovulum sp. YMD61]WGV15406.1 aldolase/citrate lyase family protein [Fuscovulum sp. YMD61]
MQFLMIVNDSEIARFVAQNGVDRLFVDLEWMGKDSRQKGLDTWKSRQTPADVSRLREAVPDAHLLVRVNPPHDGTAAEVDDALARGADSVMLPMIRTVDEVAHFVDCLAGRAEAVPLIETKSALDAIPNMVERVPLTRIHIGLNDLHLDMKLSFMFQPIANGQLEVACAAMRAAGVSFGIGGVARAREGIVSPEILLGEHVRLGSDAAILSRTFHRGTATLDELMQIMDFRAEVDALRTIYEGFQRADPMTLEANRVLARDRINDVVRLIEAKKEGA